MLGMLLWGSLVSVRDPWMWSSSGAFAAPPAPPAPATGFVLCPPGVCPSRVSSSLVGPVR